MKKKFVIASLTSLSLLALFGIASNAKSTLWIYERGKGDEPFDGKTAGIETSFIQSTKNPIALYHDDYDHWNFVNYTDENGKVIDGSVKGVIGTKNVYANFEPKTVNVKFVKDGETVVDENVPYGGSVILGSGVETSKGHEYEDFQGWNTGKEIVSGGIASVKEDTVATAKYKGKTYKINYVLDGGTAENPASYVYGEGTAPLANASKSGFSFDGWFADAEKTVKVEEIKPDRHGDVTLYAGYTEIKRPAVAVKENRTQARVAETNVAALPSNAGVKEENKTSVPSEPTFPYVGDAGAVKLSNGYEVALYACADDASSQAYSQQRVDADYSAACINASGSHLLIVDHDYGLPAAYPALLNSDTMWLYRNGNVQTLHKVYTVRGDAYGSTADGENIWSSDFCSNHGGQVVFQTCEGTGRLFTVWG